MPTIEFQLDRQHSFVELCNLLKLTGIAASGGEGKMLVANGEVSVDTRLETRKTAKIYPGQLVACRGKLISVVAKSGS